MTGLMRQVREIAAAEGAQRVVKVTVWLGALSHMSADHHEVISFIAEE